MLTRDTAHRYFWNGKRVPGITAVLEEEGVSDYSGMPLALREHSLLRGQFVHSGCELIDWKNLDETSVDPAIAGYLAGWRKFLADTSPVWTVIEQMTYHPRYGYAGQPDRAGTIHGKPWVVEIKSGAPGRGVGLQTAAQAHLLFPPGDADRKVRRGAVWLKPDGTYQLIECKGRSDFSVFLNALHLYNWKANRS